MICVGYNNHVHIFQKNILDRLRQASQLRYSELQPKHIESSHFKYHLNLLMKDGLVSQEGRGVYKLTQKGKSAVDRLSRNKINPDLTPKLITYTLLQNESNFLLQKKDKEPYLGLLNMIGGKVHINESTAEAAKREVMEKTGLTVNGLRMRGVAEIRIKANGDLLSHAVAFIFSATTKVAPEGVLLVDQSSLESRSDLAPDLLPIIDAIKASDTIFAIDLDIEWQPKT